MGLWAALDQWRRWQARRTSPLIRPGESLWALVTGASSGIGRAYAVALARRGYDVILVARRRERLEALAKTLSTEYGVDAVVMVADLVTPDGVATVEETIAGTGTLSFLVNNAGFGVQGPFWEADFQRQIDMIQLHILATVRLTRAALLVMLAQGRGAIVNVSSVMAFYPLAGSTMYAATKCYQKAFSEALYQELVGTGIRVQALCPGFVRTEFHAVGGVRRELPDFVWMTPEAVVARSLRDLEEERVVSVPGLGYRALAVVSGLLPRPIMYALARRLSASAQGRKDLAGEGI